MCTIINGVLRTCTGTICQSSHDQTRGSLTPSFDLSAAASTILNAAGGGAGDGDSEDEGVPESLALRTSGATAAARAGAGGAAGRIKTYCLRGSVSALAL